MINKLPPRSYDLKLDDRGRALIPAPLRSDYGELYRIVEQDTLLVLIPIETNKNNK